MYHPIISNTLAQFLFSPWHRSDHVLHYLTTFDKLVHDQLTSSGIVLFLYLI